MTRRLVLVESNTSGTGRYFAAVARELGLVPTLIAEEPARYPYAAQDALEVVRHPCVGRLDELAACIDALDRERPVAGVSSSSEYFIETAAELARRRGLPGPDPQAVRTCRDKGRQRVQLQACGVGGPRFVVARDTGEALHALERMALPVVVKPTQGTGSRGVRLCRSRAELEAAAAALLAIETNERGMPIPREILVEEYVTWPEYSAEFFGSTLLGIVRKHVSPEPYFVEVGHDFPARLAEHDALVEKLRRALGAVGLYWGPAHVEFRYAGGDDFAIMEINPRLAGGFIPELVRLASGIDAIAAVVTAATGGHPSLVPTRRGHASIRFICPDSEGLIRAFHGLAAAAAVDGVTDVQTYRQPGDRHAVHHDFRDRIGHVVARGDDEQAAARAALDALARIEVELECIP